MSCASHQVICWPKNAMRMIPAARDILRAVSSPSNISSDKNLKYTGIEMMNAGANRICQNPTYLYSLNIIVIIMAKLPRNVAGATSLIVEDFWNIG